MLSGKMSNEDEDEVEDELEALEREARGVPSMPDAPSVTNGELPDAPRASPKERMEARRQGRAAKNAEPMAA